MRLSLSYLEVIGFAVVVGVLGQVLGEVVVFAEVVIVAAIATRLEKILAVRTAVFVAAMAGAVLLVEMVFAVLNY